MTPSSSRAAVALAALLTTTPLAAQIPSGPPLPAIDTLALRAHTYLLSRDALAGRGAGTPGERIAAAYLAGELARLGVRGAAADGGYLQPVPLVRATVDSARTSVDVDSARFHSPRDFTWNTGGPGAFRDFAGEAVFLGDIGAALAELGTARVPLEGRVVVVASGGTLGAAAARLIPAWHRRGAAGVVQLVDDEERYALFVRSRGEARYFVDAPLDEPIWQPDLPVVLASPRLSAALLAGVPPGAAPRELERRVHGRVAVRREAVPSANVLGLLPGTHPERGREVVAYTAHYDHLGISTPDARGDSIYNGFSDNAAGAAMLLAIARALRDQPPERSVLFAFFGAEERGLLGSSYFAAHPTLPLDDVVAAINLDAGAPPAPPLTWRVAGGTVSTLGETARAVAASHGWSAQLGDPAPNSDHWGLLTRGVPAIFLIPGTEWEGVEGEARERLRDRWEHYHQASDEWHPDFPFAGLERYARYALEVGLVVANGPERPRLVPPGRQRSH